MEVKEAIEFKETIKFRLSHWEETQLNKILSLLQQGEKYRQMWLDIENMYGSSLTYPIEQKYFPKEAKQEIETSGHFFVDEYLKDKEAKQDEADQTKDNGK